MPNSKLIKISIIIALLAVILFAYYYFFLFEGKMDIQTSAGVVSINRIIKDSQLTYDKNINIKNTPDYSLDVTPVTGQFTIFVSGQNTAEALKKAENDFTKILGVNSQDACKLTVVISFPISAGPEYSDSDRSLSFCANKNISQDSSQNISSEVTAPSTPISDPLIFAILIIVFFIVIIFLSMKHIFKK